MPILRALPSKNVVKFNQLVKFKRWNPNGNRSINEYGRNVLDYIMKVYVIRSRVKLSGITIDVSRPINRDYKMDSSLRNRDILIY